LGLVWLNERASYRALLVIQQTNKAADQARLFFILGLFCFGLFHLINMCMHCGSSDPAVKRWANYSAIAFVFQVSLQSCFALTAACSETLRMAADGRDNRHRRAPSH
jgi:hypothetical protein